VGRRNSEGRWIDEGKRVEKMGEAFGVELLGSLGVALSSAHIPRLVVTDGSAVGATATLCA